MSVRSLYAGKRAVLYDALLAHDPYDQFGWCQEWRFAIADYLTWDLGASVPGFRSPSGPDIDSYPYCELVESEYTEEQLRYALLILDRYREWLRLAGEDY